MKDQTSPAIEDVIVESISIETERQRGIKPDELQEAVGVESDDDSGFLNASNGSLAGNVTHNDDARNDSGNEESETPSWRLKIPPKRQKFTDEEICKYHDYVKNEIDNIPEDEKRPWALAVTKEFFGDRMPESLLHLLTGNLFDGDCGTSMDDKPDWLDMEKFRRGQKFARDHNFGVAYAELISLLTMFCFENGLKPLIMTGRSSTPYTAYTRYLSTGLRVQNWYSTDPWTPGTPAYNDVRTVRSMHARVRKTMESMSSEEYESKTTINPAWCPALGITRQDFQSTCPAPAPGQCPLYTAADRQFGLKKHQLSQIDMSCTQFAFCGLLALNPKFFGVHYVTDEDVEAFCFVWRCYGYLLGIEDYFNFCRGTLEDIRLRSRDFLEYWVKPNFRQLQPECEHMMRCVVEGLQYYFPGSDYESCLLDLAELLNCHMPRLNASLSYSAWFKRNVVRFYFNYGSKVPGLEARMNRKMERAIEKAKNFKEETLGQLKIKSANTLDSYYMELQKKKKSEEVE